jgi:hypothetical protein
LIDLAMSKHTRNQFSRILTRGLRSGLCGILITTAGLATAIGDEDGKTPVVRNAFRPPAAATVLRTLKPQHPRLMIDPQAIRNIRGWVDRDPVAARIHARVFADADKMLKQPAPVHKLRDGRRLLSVSSGVLQRVTTLALAYHLTGRQQYVARAWRDLDAAAGFKDWNPAHFLDTAVMTCAVAIGYDWLWDQWTPPQRSRLRGAIVTLGLKPAMKVYQAKSGWHRVDYNWNQICNGGIAMGALAVAEDEPEIASKIVANALASVPRAMRAYAPDGAGKEGAGYWAFGSQYNVMLLASLESALGTDFGLGEIDGFRQSGDYQIFMSGAGRMSFDFGDCRHYALSTPQHFWMGKRYGMPQYSWFRHQELRGGKGGGAWDLLWFDPEATDAAFSKLPLDRHFAGAECVSMRDSWADTRGFTVAMQGGANNWTHRHYDLGSFILEADGVRWIIDSGKENETYQRHVNKLLREDFYRVRAEAHNTLVINPDKGAGQSADGKAAFTEFVSNPKGAGVSLDLTDAYKEHATKVRRTFQLERGHWFAVADEIHCSEPSEIWSSFHTQADVTLDPDKRKATLTQSGKSLVVLLVSPDNATFEVLPAQPGPASPKPAKQASNNGRRKLAVRLKDVRSANIKVVFKLPEN